MSRTIVIILTILYTALLLKLIVFKYPPGHVTFGEVNLIPFKTILTYLSGHPTWVVAKNNLIGNIVLFVPPGVLLALIPKRPLKSIVVAVVSLGIGVAMEITQAVLHKGVFDIDDILLNALGVAVGYLLTATIIKHINKTKQQT
jgi:glycopeptide antibiotics resistance protein